MAYLFSIYVYFMLHIRFQNIECNHGLLTTFQSQSASRIVHQFDKSRILFSRRLLSLCIRRQREAFTFNYLKVSPLSVFKDKRGFQCAINIIVKCAHLFHNKTHRKRAISMWQEMSFVCFFHEINDVIVSVCSEGQNQKLAIFVIDITVLHPQRTFDVIFLNAKSIFRCICRLRQLLCFFRLPIFYVLFFHQIKH